MKKIITTIIVLAVVVGGAFFILNKNKENNQEQVDKVALKNSSVGVRAATVAYSSIAEGFSVNGNFIAKTQTDIAAEMGGQVVALYVKEGSYVSAGQTIAKLKGDKLSVDVSNAKANLDNAIAALSRYEAAFKTGGVTALQLDQARLQVKNARAQVQSANLDSGDTTVRAKVSGIVNQKFIEVGAVINPGTPIVELVDISQVKLKVEADESLVSKLSLGQIVKIQPSVTEGTVDGRITFIAPASTGALKFPVEITVQNTGNKIKSGMYGTALFNQGGTGRVLTVPRTAFVGSVSQNQIFKIVGNKVELVNVKSGANYGDNVEIISGLNEGEQVVTSGQINLVTGSVVSVIK